MQLLNLDFGAVSPSQWLLAAAIAVTAALMVIDAVAFRLPNIGVLVLLSLYPLWVLLHPEPMHWAWALLIAGVALAIGMGLFGLGILGAGDAKFAAVAFLWAGPEAAWRFFVYFALIGGAMSVVLLTVRPMLYNHQRFLPRLLRRREPIAYGLAIGGGLMLVWWQGLAP